MCWGRGEGASQNDLQTSHSGVITTEDGEAAIPLTEDSCTSARVANHLLMDPPRAMIAYESL